MPVEAGGLVEMVHIACGGFLRFVHCGEVDSLFIPWFGVIMLEWGTLVVLLVYL